MKSIIDQTKKCYVCGRTTGLHNHHIFFGKNKHNADEDGLTVYLCWEHHEGTNGVHGIKGSKLNLELKLMAQKKWCQYYGKKRKDFIERYKKWEIIEK